MTKTLPPPRRVCMYPLGCSTIQIDDAFFVTLEFYIRYIFWDAFKNILRDKTQSWIETWMLCFLNSELLFKS